jgi:hypothetical protein
MPKMRVLSVLAVFSLFLCPAGVARADGLPASLQAELDDAVVGSSVQLTANRSLEQISSDDFFKRQVAQTDSENRRQLKKSLGMAGGASAAGGVTAIALAGATMTAATSGLGGFDADAIKAFEHSMSWGFTSLGAGAALGAGNLVLSRPAVNELLDDGKVDQYALVVAKKMAVYFQLTKAQESALSTAIARRIRSGQPMDLVDVLTTTEFAGKSILTPEEAAAVKSLPSKAAGGQTLDEGQKLSYLIYANAVISTQLELKKNDLSKQAQEKLENQQERNAELLDKIRDLAVAGVRHYHPAASSAVEDQQPGQNATAQ